MSGDDGIERVWFTAQVSRGMSGVRARSIVLYWTEDEAFDMDVPPSLEETSGTIQRPALDALAEQYRAGRAKTRQRLRGDVVISTSVLLAAYRKLREQERQANADGE